MLKLWKYCNLLFLNFCYFLVAKKFLLSYLPTWPQLPRKVEKSFVWLCSMGLFKSKPTMFRNNMSGYIFCASKTVSLGGLFDWKKLFETIWHLVWYSVHKSDQIWSAFSFRMHLSQIMLNTAKYCQILGIGFASFLFASALFWLVLIRLGYRLYRFDSAMNQITKALLVQAYKTAYAFMGNCKGK